MLSKMAQSNNVGAGGAGPAVGGRRVPLSLSSGTGSSSSVSRLQQAASGSNGRSNSPNMNNKKNEQAANGPFVSIKKVKEQQSSSSSNSSSLKESKEKKNQNGVSKSTNGNQKSSQNGGSSNVAVSKEQQKKEKEKHAEKPKETKEEAKPIVAVKEAESEVKVAATPTAESAVDAKKNKEPVAAAEIIELDDEPEAMVVPEPTTPTSERKSSRKTSNQQKTPTKAEQIEALPQEQKKEPETVEIVAANLAEAVEDVEMETLVVEASPIRSEPVSQPAATSTPGRNLFGFRSNSKQTKEVELAAQPSSSPAGTPARTFAQISGRRSIRPETALTPGKLGNYRCINTSELDTSNCTNTSMNATVGSEIPNSSSFSFSFFGRGRKRERTPPPLAGSQSTTDLARDIEMSPPKRARFELFSMNLASPFSMLRSRFSKATINSPSTRLRLDDTPPAGEEEEAENGGEVQNVSGIVIQEEEKQLNKSTASNEVIVAQEAGLETPKKGGSPVKEAAEDNNKDVELNNKDVVGDDLVANVPAAEVEGSTTEVEGANRSRCAIM
ncbi:immunoglobulin A1 protease autotransporter [Drosophila nasuta]|uniref:immunoglobulin A1 protease autotransporter n=1 Tax=Drosophila nasuta TaxID=42062 RepID=UPI00295E3B8D|nr:immunoglobulin A1 protease autotransporter [Drosophila nasuta]